MNEKIIKRLAALMSVKSIVTLALTAVFAYLAVTGQIAQDFMTVYAVVIAFYFGTQSQKVQDVIGGGDNNCSRRPGRRSDISKRRPTPSSITPSQTLETATGINMPVIWMPWAPFTTAEKMAMPGATASWIGVSSTPSAWRLG